MLTKEDVDSWNKLFPDCQINKANLRNPHEHFLTNALVNYLRKFGFKIDAPFNLNAESKENNKETRVFLIKLARQIDHFLKITDKGYSFTYYDLIRPTPKKTSHMLYILLNYYYYYHQYKKNVFEMGNDRIQRFKELKGLIEDSRRENELRKEENESIKSVVENLKEEERIAHTNLRELDEKRMQQEEEFQKLNHTYQELKEKLKHLEEQRKILRKRVVPNEESQELEKQLQQLKLELAEHKELEFSIEVNLNECIESNDKLQKLSNEIENAHDIFPLRLLKQVQDTKKQLSHVHKEEHELQHKHDSIMQEIEEKNDGKCSLELEQENIMQELDIKNNKHTKALDDKQNTLKQKKDEILQLEREDHIFECQLEEQKDIAEYLKQHLSELFIDYED